MYLSKFTENNTKMTRCVYSESHFTIKYNVEHKYYIMRIVSY